MKCPFLCKWNTWQSGCTKPTLERCPHGRAVDCLCGAGRGLNETQPCTDPKPETKEGDIIYGGGGGSNESRPYITPYKPFTGNGASVEPSKKVVQFQSYNVSMGEAVEIFKFRLDDPNIAHQSKLLAIEKVANMETHNSITKDELVKGLRWLFERYDFEGGV